MILKDIIERFGKLSISEEREITERYVELVARSPGWPALNDVRARKDARHEHLTRRRGPRLAADRIVQVFGVGQQVESPAGAGEDHERRAHEDLCRAEPQ